jgi:serine/threonine protein kinase
MVATQQQQQQQPQSVPPSSASGTALHRSATQGEMADLEWDERSVGMYTRERKIGEGTFGAVYVARTPNGLQVALKRVLTEKEKEGFPITSIREIKILKQLQHPNIVRVSCCDFSHYVLCTHLFSFFTLMRRIPSHADVRCVITTVFDSCLTSFRKRPTTTASARHVCTWCLSSATTI